MDKKLHNFIAEKLYPSLNIIEADLLQELRPAIRKDKKSCDLVCPDCWNATAFHYFGTGSISCSSCMAQTDILDALVATSDQSLESALETVLKKLSIVIPPEISGKPKPSKQAAKPVRTKPTTQKLAKVNGGWLLSQLRLWLKEDEQTVVELEKCGWSADLISKSPVGYLPSKKAFTDLIDGRLPTGLYKSLDTIESGLVVPWFIGNTDVVLWGYSGSITTSSPAEVPLESLTIACHLHHPIHKRHSWMVVVADPLLASLLIGRGIPACAVGDEQICPISSKSLAKVEKELYVMAEADSQMFKDIVNHSPNAKLLDNVAPLAFGPYHGAYYRRFCKWPFSRFKKLAPAEPTYSIQQVIGMLSAMLDAEVPFDDAVDVIKNKTGQLVSIKPIARSEK